MPVTFGGYRCLDPLPLERDCQAAGLPADWYGTANRFTCPLGPGPGVGHVLLSGAALTALDLNARHDLAFTDGSPGGTVTLKGLLVTATRCLTPGRRGDPVAAHHVTLADRRHDLRLVPAAAAYNLLNADGTAYLDESSIDGVGGAWGWQDMIDDLAEALGLDAAPHDLTLPYAPDGDPEQFDFYAEYAWAALNLVLGKLGCAAKYDPLADAVTVVALGAADTAAGAVVARADGLRDWDADPAQALTLASVPAGVRVLFRRRPAPDDGSDPFYAVDLPAPASVTTATAAGTRQILFDDLAALGATGAPSNAAALATRAAERRDTFYQWLLADVLALSRRYAVPTPELAPGAQLKAVVWEDRGGGLKTEIYRGPKVLPAPGDYVTPAVPPPAGTPGSDVRIVRTFSTVQNAAGTQVYVAGEPCPLSAEPPIYYLGTLAHFDEDGCLVNDCDGETGTLDDCSLVWLTPLYQPAYTGGIATTHLNPGMPYVALKTQATKTLTINTLDGGGLPGEENIRDVTAPVYVTALQPIVMVCDETGPQAFSGPY